MASEDRPGKRGMLRIGRNSVISGVRYFGYFDLERVNKMGAEGVNVTTYRTNGRVSVDVRDLKTWLVAYRPADRFGSTDMLEDMIRKVSAMDTWKEDGG